MLKMGLLLCIRNCFLFGLWGVGVGFGEGGFGKVKWVGKGW